MNASVSESLAYTAGGAAAACGLPRQSVDHAIKTGELPAMRSGRRYIVLREDVLAWLRRCRDRGEIPVPVNQADRERLAGLNRARKRVAA